MDIGVAYNRLGIEDRTIDDDLILTTFEIRLTEGSGLENDLRAALKAIGKSKGSVRIERFLQGNTAQQVAPDWPVGLENIGNTCYLNSLLQFYFTVTPLRELILDFSNFKMDITPENLAAKRVGSRKVSRKEIERSQSCEFSNKSLALPR